MFGGVRRRETVQTFRALHSNSEGVASTHITILHEGSEEKEEEMIFEHEYEEREEREREIQWA